MGKDQTATSKPSRQDKYAKLQKKRRRFFFSHKIKGKQRQHANKQKPPFPRWPIHIDSIRLAKKKHDPASSSGNIGSTTDNHRHRLLDISLRKLHDSLDARTSAQYKSTLDHAVDDTTAMIHNVMYEIGKGKCLASPQEENALGYEDVLLAALGANVPPVVVQRALERMKTRVALKDPVTEQIIHQACHPLDIYGTAGKSLASLESIYGFISPVEGGMNASFLPVEAEYYKYEPKYMDSLRPSFCNGGMDSGTMVEHRFLNMTTDGTLPSGSK